MSGLQNVRFTKRQVSKRLVSKRPVSNRTEPADFHQPQVQNVYGCFFGSEHMDRIKYAIDLTKPNIMCGPYAIDPTLSNIT
jgi:hypothetical protein